VIGAAQTLIAYSTDALSYDDIKAQLEIVRQAIKPENDIIHRRKTVPTLQPVLGQTAFSSHT
jgi:hypothetical protein